MAASPQMHARLGLLNGYLPTSKGRPWVASRDTSYLDGSPAEGIDDSVMGRAWGSWEVRPVPWPSCFLNSCSSSQPSPDETTCVTLTSCHHWVECKPKLKKACSLEPATFKY